MDALIEMLPGMMLVGIIILWMVLRFRFKIAKQGMNKDDIKTLQQLQQTAIKMEERVKVLEKILDVQAPNWRRSR